MDDTKVYVSMSDDILAWMADNDLSIQDVLDKAGIDAEVDEGVLPTAGDAGSRTKDVVPIILADGAAITAVLMAVSHFMRSWWNRPIYETWDELEEIRDPDGNVLLDKDGNPRMKMVRKHVLIEPGKNDRKEKINLQAGLKGLIFGISSEQKQVQEAPPTSTTR